MSTVLPSCCTSLACRPLFPTVQQNSPFRCPVGRIGNFAASHRAQRGIKVVSLWQAERRATSCPLGVPGWSGHPRTWGTAPSRTHPLPAMSCPCSSIPLSEYSSLLTRVICLKTKISSDYRKEQQFSTLALFGDTICVSLHILFSFIGCGIVKKGMRYICHVHRKSTKITVTSCGRQGRRQGSGVLLEGHCPWGEGSRKGCHGPQNVYVGTGPIPMGTRTETAWGVTEWSLTALLIVTLESLISLILNCLQGFHH